MIRKMGMLSALLGISLGSAACAAAPVQSYDAYKSWLVACDNTLECVAKGFEDGGQPAEMRITRAAGATGGIRVSIAAESRFSPSDLALDGKPLRLTQSGWSSGSDESGSWIATTSETAARALVAALRDGDILTLGSGANVPLTGFSAAMLRLDERQGRIGGVTALLKTGTLPASQVAKPVAIPTLRHHPITARLKNGEDTRLIDLVHDQTEAIFREEECSQQEDLTSAQAYALDDRKALVLMPCLMGAYQGSSLAFIASRQGKDVRRLALEAPFAGNTNDPLPLNLFTEASFDPENGMFSTAAKGRGLADCGMSATWIWDGSDMILSAMSLQQACGGIEPGDWPTLFRSQQ